MSQFTEKNMNLDSKLEISNVHEYPFSHLTFEERQKCVETLRKKYPRRYPILVKVGGNQKFYISKRKYLMPDENQSGKTTFQHFFYNLRKYVELSSQEAIFVFLENNTQVPSVMTMDLIYEKYHNPDGFLYFQVFKENAFG